MNKTLVISLLFVVLSVSVFAAPPQNPTLQESSGGLELSNPMLSVYKLDTTIKLHFHLFNSTGGTINDTNATCFLHLYSGTSHIAKVQLKFDSPADYETSFNSTVINKTGEYPYVAYCNYKGEGAFLSSEIIVTESGEYDDITEDNNITVTFIILMVSVSIMLVVMGFILSNSVLVMFGGLFLIVIGFNILTIGLPMFVWLIPIVAGVVISTSYKEE